MNDPVALDDDPLATTEENLAVMGVPLTEALLAMLLDRIDSGELDSEQLLAAWREVARIDRWIGEIR